VGWASSTVGFWGYTRYDFKTATKLLNVVDSLIRKYNGKLVEIHRLASDSRDLENRLKELGKGVGDVTVGIFLRELRGTWKKADPLPQPLASLASNRLGFTRLRGRDQFERGKILEDLKRIWIENRLKGKGFVNFETALVRIGKDVFRHRKKSSLSYPFPGHSK